MDLKIDDNFEIVIDEKKDLATVSGKDQLRQQLVSNLAIFQRDIIGDLNSPNAIRKVRQEVNRSLNEHPDVDIIDLVEIEKVNSGSVEVFIKYNDGEIINETV